MPFVFNNLNQKLENAQIEEAELQSKRIAALGKQLEEDPAPVEKLSSFVDKYNWLPKDILAGLGIASLTNPAINLDDQEPFVGDLVRAWTKHSKENASRLGALTKGSIRGLFVGFDAAAERILKRPIQAAGGVYTGENINPTVALFDIIPGLGFTLAKGLGMTDMSYSEFFTKREQKLQELGPTVGELAVKKLAAGEKVNLGTGFFGNSTMAEDTTVYEEISKQTQDPEILESARKLIQEQLGDPITIEERKRVNANSYKFDDGNIRPISPGLLFAHNFVSPSEKGYNMISGLVDGIFTLGLDPANLAGGYFAKAGRLKKSLNPNVVKNRFITGRLARKMVHVPNSKEYLSSPAVREIAAIGAKAKDIRVQRQLLRDQVKDPKTLRRLIDAETPDEWIQAIDDYGLKNIDKRFEKSSKFHVDYKDGEKILKMSPEHFKQRRVVDLYKERFNLFTDTLPTGGLKDYSMRFSKSVLSSPVGRAIKDLPQTTLNASDLPEVGMLLDDWLDFMNAPMAMRNSLNKKMVDWIDQYNFRAQMAADYRAGILTDVDIDMIKEASPSLRNINLKRDPSLVSVRSQIQDMITGDNQMSGILYKDKDGNAVRHTIFGWFDDWAESQGLPPIALKTTRDLIANTNEGKRAYLVDRLGKPEFFPGTATGKGTDAIIKNVQEETLKALPTASKLTEYLSYAITMPDPRELSRYLGNVRNSFAFMATLGAKTEFPRALIMAEKRPGQLTEEVATGFLRKLGRETRNMLKYKITDEGIEQATLLKVLNKYMTKAWKPLALLRFAWTLRVVGEEQMRMWASDLDNVFTSPISYFSYWFGDNAPMKTLGGNMQNAMKYKAAMSKGHGGFMGVNHFGRDRVFETVDKSSKKYGSYLANNHLLYINDALAQDLFPAAIDITGKKLDLGDAKVIFQRESLPFNKKQINAIIGDNQEVVLDKTVGDFLADLRDGLVVSDVEKYANLDKTVEKILRRELEYLTQGFQKNMNLTFRPAAIIAKLMKVKANAKMFDGFSKNLVLDEVRRVLDDYAVTNSPTVKEIPLKSIPANYEFVLDKLADEGTTKLLGTGAVGDIVGIPNKKGQVSYYRVDRVDVLKQKVSPDEEFALTLQRAQEVLEGDGYTKSEVNKLLGGIRAGKQKLNKSDIEAIKQDVDSLIGYAAVNDPITRIKRGDKNVLKITDNVFKTKEGIIDLNTFEYIIVKDGLVDMKKFADAVGDDVAAKRIEQLNHLGASNAESYLREILYYGFGKNIAGKQVRQPKRFFTVRATKVNGIARTKIKPTKLGQKVIDLGLVSKAEDLELFAKNGSGITAQALKVYGARLEDLVKKNIKLLDPAELGEEILEDLIRGNKIINGQIDSLLRQNTILTLTPTEKKSFNFATDLVEQKVAQVISGGQTGADIAGLKIAAEKGIPTGGRLPRRYMTEDGPNYSLQSRYGLVPDTNPLDSQTLANKGIIPKGPYSKAKWNRKKKQWTDEVDGEEFVLDLKKDAGKIAGFEYRSRAIKNVDQAHVTIILTKAGVEATGTKSTFEYAVNRRWGKGKDKTGYIYQDDDILFPDKAKHKVFSKNVSDARTDYSKNKDVIVINIDKFIADGGVVDADTMQRIDLLLSKYDSPIVNIAGPAETRITPVLKEKVPEVGKRKYVQDELTLAVDNTKAVEDAKSKLPALKKDLSKLEKDYKQVEIDLQNRIRAIQGKDSKLKFNHLKINVPFGKQKEILAKGDGDVAQVKAKTIPSGKLEDTKLYLPDEIMSEIKKTWVKKDSAGNVISKLDKGELKIVEEALQNSLIIFRQKARKYSEIERLQKVVDADGAFLPSGQSARLQYTDSELLRPFENKVAAALEQILEGSRKSRHADSFEGLVSKYTGENREYFKELASDSFDQARKVKQAIYDSDLLIESAMKGYLADIHLLAGGDYDIILKNTNDVNFSYQIEEGKTLLKSRKDPNLSVEVKGTNANPDAPVTVNIDGEKKVYRTLKELQEARIGLYHDFVPEKSIPKNPMGNKSYNSLEEMYEDGYYFDYNITQTGDQEMLRVMAGVDPFRINYKGGMVEKYVSPNMTHTDRRAYIKWLETKKHLGPTRVKGARTTPTTKEGLGTALDQATEYMFDLFMSGPTNMFSRSPAFMQFYMDKIRQLAPFADEATKKRIVADFELAWGITKNEGVDVGLVRQLNDKRKDLWFDRNFRQEFLKDMAAPKIDEVFDIKDIPKDKQYTMNFNMPPADNIYNEATTTMDLVRSGRRRSTTRKWKTLPAKGDIISFSDKNNNRILVKVTAVKSWKDVKGSVQELTKWSKDEGWTVTYGLKKAFFNKYDPKDVHKVEFDLYTDKVYTTFDEIDTVAKAYALEETKRLLYDLDKRGQITDALRLVFPFGEAYKEILTTQFRLLKNNPQKLRKATIAIQGARRDSIFGSDPSHNEGFFAKDPMTGEEMYNFTDPGGLLTGMVVGDSVDNTGVRLNLKGYVRNLNMLTTTILPGVGPVVQIPAAAISGATEFSKLGDLLFPYGRPEVRSGLAGILDIPKAFAQASIPSYMRKLFTAFGRNPAGRRDVDGFDPGSDPAGALASTVKDILKVRAYAGTADFSTIEAQNAEIKSATNAARVLTGVRAAVQFIWFTGAEPRYEALVSPGGQAFLDPSGTEEIDPDGRMVSFNSLVQGYYRLYSMAEESIRNNAELAGQDPQMIATQAYMTLFGDNPIPLLIRKTREIEPYPMGETGLKWARENKQAFAEAPNTAAFARPYEPYDEFSIRAWRESISKGKRVGLTPEQWIHLNNQAIGRIAETHISSELDNNPNFALWTPMQKNHYMASVNFMLQDLFPGFGSQLTAAGPTDLDTKLRELRRWKNIPGLGDSQAGKALESYLRYRDSLMEFHKLQTGNQLISIEGSQALAVRNAMRLFANQLIIQYPEFRYLYSSILSRELEEDERSVPDGFRILGY
mgnify:FL=1